MGSKLRPQGNFPRDSRGLPAVPNQPLHLANIWYRAGSGLLLGGAIAFRIAPGQAREFPHAIPLLEHLPGVPMWVGGDRGYNKPWLSRAHLEHGRGARHPTAAPRGTRSVP